MKVCFFWNSKELTKHLLTLIISQGDKEDKVRLPSYALFVVCGTVRIFAHFDFVFRKIKKTKMIKLERMQKRMTIKVAKRMTKLTKRMTIKVAKRMIKLTKRMTKLIKRMTKLTRRTTKLTRRMTKLTKRIIQLMTRATKVTRVTKEPMIKETRGPKKKEPMTRVIKVTREPRIKAIKEPTMAKRRSRSTQNKTFRRTRKTIR